MEEDLKILKVEYLRKHLLDQTQILNLGLDDQTFLYLLQASLRRRYLEVNLQDVCLLSVLGNFKSSDWSTGSSQPRRPIRYPNWPASRHS
jgi:hypothetical protein